MMGQPRSIFLVLLLLVPWLPVSADDAVTPHVAFDAPQGYVQESGAVVLTGTANVPLNEVAWALRDVATDAVLQNGSFLETVTPDGDDTWTWSHNLSVPETGCSCTFTVVQGSVTAELVLYLGAAGSWAPVWIPNGFESVEHDGHPHSTKMDNLSMDSVHHSVILNGVDPVVVELPLIFPPQRLNGSTVEIQRCEASSNGVCTSPITVLMLPIQDTEASASITFTPEQWSPEGHWSVTSMVVIDSVLSRSTSVTWEVLHDVTPPTASIESPATANESERVFVLINATDPTSGQVHLADLRTTAPDGVVTVLDHGVNSLEASFSPHLAGRWLIEATVQDGAGLNTVVARNLQVSNLPPEGNIRFNGALVTPGDRLQVYSGESFILDASGSLDTGNDALSLHHVWWIDVDGRLSGLEQLTEERFQAPGTYEIRFQIVDDDGASDEIQFSLEVVEGDDSLAEVAFVAPLVLLLVGIGITTLFILRTKSKSTDIPTWPGEVES